MWIFSNKSYIVCVIDLVELDVTITSSAHIWVILKFHQTKFRQLTCLITQQKSKIAGSKDYNFKANRTITMPKMNSKICICYSTINFFFAKKDSNNKTTFFFFMILMFESHLDQFYKYLLSSTSTLTHISINFMKCLLYLESFTCEIIPSTYYCLRKDRIKQIIPEEQAF